MGFPFVESPILLSIVRVRLGLLPVHIALARVDLVE